MISLPFCFASTLVIALACRAEGKFVLDSVGKPRTQEEIGKGEIGFRCLKELFGEEGEHILTQNPMNHRSYGKNEEGEMTDQERYEAIFMVFGEEGIENMCDITRKLRKARFLTSKGSTERKPDPSIPERRAQACIKAQPMYPSEHDINGSYNNWAKENVDPFLEEGADRTSRTSPDKLISEIQDSIDVAMEAEYASMACRPIFNGIEALVSIPDLVVFQQGSIVGGIKSIVCNFGSQVASYATGNLYRQLARARFHDYHIDGAEQAATYVNTGNMVNQVCKSGQRLNVAVNELADIKRKLETRRG